MDAWRAAVVLVTSLTGLACSTEAPADTQTETSTGTTSTETETSSGESEDSAETDADTGLVGDQCPAKTTLEQIWVTFDGQIEAWEYPDYAEWTRACTVASRRGELATTEVITLDCIDEREMPVEHVIELEATVTGKPTLPATTVLQPGQSVTLTLWSAVWFGGTAAWLIRDLDQNPLLVYYISGGGLPTPGFPGDDYVPPASLFEPLSFDIVDDLCDWVCNEDLADSWEECGCDLELGIELGRDGVTTVVQHGSAGVITGAPAIYGVVLHAKWYRDYDCVSDAGGSYYGMLLLAGDS